MSKMPLFSLITPIYKVEKYLPKCIESMINQTFKDIEIILVDDGSPDHCPQICDEYASKDSRIKVVHKENGGLVSARQAGSEQVTGRYTINVDGDDWIAHDYCEKMAKVIEEHHPDIVMCGHYNAFENHNDMSPLPYRIGYYSRNDIEKEILPILLQDEYGHSFRLSLWAKATESCLQQQQQLVDVVVNVGEDAACMASCIFHAKSLYIMEDCLYYYRQNPTSMTKSGKVFAWDGPEIRGRHLEKQIDMNFGNMREQLYRGTVHSLFTVVKSQFNRTDASLKEIENDIREHLSASFYKTALIKARFKGKKARLMHLGLKHRVFWLIRLFNRVSG